MSGFAPDVSSRCFFCDFPVPAAAAGDVPWCHACLFPTQHDTRSARDHIQPTRRCPAQRPQGIVGNLSPKRLPACLLGLAAADMLNVAPLCWGARGRGDGEGWGGELKKRSCQIAGGPMSAARQTDRCINHTPALLRVPASPPPPRCGPTPPVRPHASSCTRSAMMSPVAPGSGSRPIAHCIGVLSAM